MIVARMPNGLFKMALSIEPDDTIIAILESQADAEKFVEFSNKQIRASVLTKTTFCGPPGVVCLGDTAHTGDRPGPCFVNAADAAAFVRATEAERELYESVDPDDAVGMAAFRHAGEYTQACGKKGIWW